MKLKVVVLEGDAKINLSLWGSKSGASGGFAAKGAEFVVEGDQVSMTGADPIPGQTDAGLGGGGSAGA